MHENFDYLDLENDIFDLNMDASEIEKNSRKAVRYVRNDISAILVKKTLFRCNETMVQLLDISTKGALISYSGKLSTRSRVSLKLIFQDGKEFLLPASVVHLTKSPQLQYGLKFDASSEELGDHLLHSQSDLAFR